MTTESIELVPTETVLGYASAQFRVENDTHALDDLAAAWRKGEKIDPPVVFEDAAGRRVVSDGHHRIHGAALAKQPQITIRVRRGSELDALDYAAEANPNDRVRSRPADRQNGARRTLTLAPERSNRAIAERWGISPTTVQKLREELFTGVHSGHLTERVGADGKRYPVPETTRRDAKPDKILSRDDLRREPPMHLANEGTWTAEHTQAVKGPIASPCTDPVEVARAQTEIPASAYVAVPADDDDNNWPDDGGEPEVIDATAAPEHADTSDPAARGDYGELDEAAAMQATEAAARRAIEAIDAALAKLPLHAYRHAVYRDGAIGALTRLLDHVAKQMPAPSRTPENNRRAFGVITGGK